MELLVVIVAVVSILTILILFFNIIFTILEHNYGLLFNKPFFVHLYFKNSQLSENQLFILRNEFSFYHSLSDKSKKHFEHRIVKFIENYEFIGKENFEITDQVKVLIASTSVMLTFGMRNYLYENINKIIVYPTEYYSTMNDAYHKGEFNPRMQAVVFSWEDFILGFDIANDNLNLGIHEFTHVLHFNSLKSDAASATIFVRMFKKIAEEIHHEPNKDRLLNSNHFRAYAYTNQFEFLAVIIEHFFESPVEFRQEFPELYRNVGLMLNLKL